MNNYYVVLSMTRVNDPELRNIAKTMCSLYDGNLLSLNGRNMNLPSCFSITGSVEHIISVNTIESGRSTASGRRGFRSGSMVVLRASWALQWIRK